MLWLEQLPNGAGLVLEHLQLYRRVWEPVKGALRPAGASDYRGIVAG
jgi:hypothetical protein